MDAAVFEQVYEMFVQFHACFGPLFDRREARDLSLHYPQALLVQSGERRNAENPPETVPVSALAMQRFLSESPQGDDAVMERLQAYLAPNRGILRGVWVLDGSDFPSSGENRRGWPVSAAAD